MSFTKISPLSYLQDGATALFMAAQEGKADVVRLLIEAGAQLDIQRTVCAILALSNAVLPRPVALGSYPEFCV